MRRKPLLWGWDLRCTDGRRSPLLWFPRNCLGPSTSGRQTGPSVWTFHPFDDSFRDHRFLQFYPQSGKPRFTRLTLYPQPSEETPEAHRRGGIRQDRDLGQARRVTRGLTVGTTVFSDVGQTLVVWSEKLTPWGGDGKDRRKEFRTFWRLQNKLPPFCFSGPFPFVVNFCPILIQAHWFYFW